MKLLKTNICITFLQENFAVSHLLFNFAPSLTLKPPAKTAKFYTKNQALGFLQFPNFFCKKSWRFVKYYVFLPRLNSDANVKAEADGWDYIDRKVSTKALCSLTSQSLANLNQSETKQR